MTLLSLFINSCKEFNSKPAFIMRDRFRLIKWTYNDLMNYTQYLAQVLSDHNVKKGDRVILFSGNSPYWVASFFAILARGAIVVPLNPRSPANQLNRIVKQGKPKLLLKSLHTPWPAKEMKSLTIEDVLAFNIAESPAIDKNIVNLEDIAEIVYTSGTTGDPKGVVLTHNNIISNLEGFNRAFPAYSSDHILTILPLFHMYAQMGAMFFSIRIGASVSFVPTPSSRAIQIAFYATPTTHLLAVPEFLKISMGRIEQKAGRLISSSFVRALPKSWRRLLFSPIRNRLSPRLHTIACGGAPLDPDVEKKWRVLGFDVLQGYGLTETSPILTFNTYKYHRIGSVGKPLDNVELKVAEDGELLARGPNVMGGYYKDEKRTAEAFKGDWFRTDDEGRIDDDGFVYVFGRKKYMIVTAAGENVFPEDIEEVLNRQAGVKDSAVIGLEKEGQISIHAVLLREEKPQPEAGPSLPAGKAPLAEKEIIKKTNRQLAPHQHITEWSIWPQNDFPRSATRKVQKGKVIDWLKKQKKPPKEVAAHKITPLISLISEITSLTPNKISPSSQLGQDLQMDSLMRIELVARIEEDFQARIEEPEIGAQTTIVDIEKMIEQRKGTAARVIHGLRWSAKKWVRYIGQVIQTVVHVFFLSFFVKLKVENLENLPKDPILLMPNHRSYADAALVLKALPRKHRRYMALAAAVDVLYTKYRFIAPLVELAYHSFRFPRTEQENVRPGLEYAGRLIDSGYSIMVFPEGAMNTQSKGLLQLKRGAGLMAIEMGVPVIPVIIKGIDDIIPAGLIIPRKRGEVTIKFGKPLKFRPSENYVKATEKIEQALKDLL